MSNQFRLRRCKPAAYIGFNFAATVCHRLLSTILHYSLAWGLRRNQSNRGRAGVPYPIQDVPANPVRTVAKGQGHNQTAWAFAAVLLLVPKADNSSCAYQKHVCPRNNCEFLCYIKSANFLPIQEKIRTFPVKFQIRAPNTQCALLLRFCPAKQSFRGNPYILCRRSERNPKMPQAGLPCNCGSSAVRRSAFAHKTN